MRTVNWGEVTHNISLIRFGCMETKEIMGTTIASRGPVVDITSLGREILLRKV